MIKKKPTWSTHKIYYILDFFQVLLLFLYHLFNVFIYVFLIQIYETIFYGKKLRCINREPNSYKNFMVNLEYLVRVHFPMCSVERCARILTSRFKIAVVPANKYVYFFFHLSI